MTSTTNEQTNKLKTKEFFFASISVIYKAQLELCISLYILIMYKQQLHIQLNFFGI
jgi:hypothetical protein